MGIRINIEPEGSVTVLQVAGQLDRASVAQFTEVIESIEGNITMDLSELIFADDVGVDAIRRVKEKLSDIRGASVFIQLLINGSSPNRTE
jgi:anti-anti-sigma regulatory factor